MASTTPAEARPRPAGGGGGLRDFVANKTFGLGLELGSPTGLNGKYFVSDNTALDFGLGWNYGPWWYGEGFHLYGDFLFHPFSFVSARAFELPFYVGPGLRYWNFRYYYDRFGNSYYGGSALGIRVPVGIAFDFNDIPLDIFIQGVPTLDFLVGDYYDVYCRGPGRCSRVGFGFDFSVGVRYWFK